MVINNLTVAICMATYNGEKYLPEQIDSILRQSYQNFMLFIRDDCSTDKTLEILKSYQKKYSDKIIVISDNSICKSAKKNFASILEWVNVHYDFHYFMFSDQDDIWLENKIEKTLSEMLKQEKKEIKPYLIHTDLRVVDQNLNTLGNSFFSYRALNYEKKDTRHLLVQNNITGCTMLWNKAFNDLIDIKDENVAMHDWWMAVVASMKGEIICVPEATILYRQHEDNVVGATKVNTLSFIVKRLSGGAHIKETFQIAFKQANAILEKYRDQLTIDQIQDLEKFIQIQNSNKIKKIMTIIKQGYTKQGIIQIIGEIIFI